MKCVQNDTLLAYASFIRKTSGSHLISLTFQLTTMSRNLSPKSRRAAHPSAANGAHDRHVHFDKGTLHLGGDEGDVDEEEEEDEGLGGSSGGDSSPANGEREQVCYKVALSTKSYVRLNES